MNLPFFRTPGTPDVDCVTQVAQAAGGLRWTQLGAKCDRHGRITYRIPIRYWFVFDENLLGDIYIYIYMQCNVM